MVQWNQANLLTVLAAAIATIAVPANAQRRVITTPVPNAIPAVQQPNISGMSQAIAALSLKLDSLRASVGRQVVVLHFTPTETGGWTDADNNFDKNTKRGEDICRDALGDRYGRVLSRKPMMNYATNRWFFPHVICETNP